MISEYIFSYDYAGLLENYKVKSATHPYNNIECWNNIKTGLPVIDWRYRYSPTAEREQKRMYEGLVPNHKPSYPWVYYLLGSDGKQLAVYNGLQSTHCTGNEQVYIYPSEYLSYGAEGLANITTQRNGRKEYSVFDHLGSVRVKLNEEGDIISYYDYEPFGKQMSTSVAPRLSFIDKEKDKESSLNDFGVRKYDDYIGRFTRIDPLFEKYYSLTPYQYSANNPITRIDQTGLAYFITNEGRDTKILSDNIDDGLVYTSSQDAINFSTTKDDNGNSNLDYSALRMNSNLLPNKETRGDILKNHFSSIQGEAGSVGGFDKMFYGGRNYYTSATNNASSQKEVENAILKADENNYKSKLLYYIHDHPLKTTGNPSTGDYDSFKTFSKSPFNVSFQYGILIYMDQVTIFDPSGSKIIMSKELFKSIGK